MTKLKVEVVRLRIEEHPEADRLEIAQVGGYRAIVAKGAFQTGDLAAYIPEQSVLPPAVIETLGLQGKLAGSERNRITAVRLRGIFSQGVCYPARPGWVEGQDVAEELGITKYIPAIPVHLAGEVFVRSHTLPYDIENIKRFPDVIREGEAVIFTEKLHGTFACYGLLPEADAHPEEGRTFATSKGMGAKGLALKNNAVNATNAYVREALKGDLYEKLEAHFGNEEPTYLLGEICGVQDLKYGGDRGRTLFRAFDIYRGYPKQGRYLDDAELDEALRAMRIERVPVLYRGPFSEALLSEHTTGRETLTGKSTHIREGLVVRPLVEREEPELGRVQLKSVSSKYLLRKKGTEWN